MKIRLILCPTTICLMILMVVGSGCAQMDTKNRYYGAGTSYSTVSRTYTPQRVVTSPTSSYKYQSPSPSVVQTYCQKSEQIAKRAAEVSKSVSQQTKDIQRRVIQQTKDIQRQVNQQSAPLSRRATQPSSQPPAKPTNIVFFPPRTNTSTYTEPSHTTYQPVTVNDVPSFSDIVATPPRVKNNDNTSTTNLEADISWLFWVIAIVVVFVIVFYYCRRNNNDPWVLDPSRH